MTAAVELLPSFAPRPRAAHVVFDFDGTLSLIREGWADLMAAVCFDALPGGAASADAAFRELVHDDIARLTGQESIHQMVRLSERVRERCGVARDPHADHRTFLRALQDRTATRMDELRDGTAGDRYLVHGSRDLLDRLTNAGLTLHLASGTPEDFVRREADLLGIADYFGGRIHGPTDDSRTFTKRAVIDAILRDHGTGGNHLIAFGDGAVEIAETKAVGGLAVAVASDEAANGSGRVDARKRERLIAAGADAVIADYRDAAGIVSLILGR